MTAAPSSETFFVTGGTLHPDAPSYIARQADRELLAALLQGEFCYVLDTRQVGKSSLMARAAAHLSAQGVRVARLDLTRAGQPASQEAWYYGLLLDLGREIGLREELRAFWQAHRDIPPLQRWMEALRHAALPALDADAAVPGRLHTPRLVVFVDEIDYVLNLPFSSDEFFAGIRECYTRRAHDPAMRRLTFCLLGSATPDNLIRDARATPFNIGTRIQPTDFTEEEAAPLAAGLGGAGRDGRRLLQRILHWTSGHPYLTQKFCQAIAADPSAVGAGDVDRMCGRLFLSREAREGESNLAFSSRRILHSEEDAASLLDLYQRVRCRRRGVRDNPASPLHAALRLSGLVRAQDGFLHPRNRIYAHVFDCKWIQDHLPGAELRRQRLAYRLGLLRAGGFASVFIAIAIVAFVQAQKQRTAEAKLRKERETLYAQLASYTYVVDMITAQRAWEDNDLPRVRSVLDRYSSSSGKGHVRGFEWRYFWQQAQDDSFKTLRAHEGGVFSIAFSPDGKTLASAGKDRTVRLWDPASGLPVKTLHGHANTVSSVAFSPNGKLLVSGAADGRMLLWNARDPGKPLPFAPPKTDGVNSVAFSPDSRRIVVGSNSGSFLCDTTGKQVLDYHSVGSWCYSAAISPDKRTWAIGGEHGNILLWDVASDRQIALLKGKNAYPGYKVFSVAFSPDGGTLAAANFDGSIGLWDMKTRREETLAGQTAMVRSVAFSPDSRLLASGSIDHTVRLWDVETRRQIAVFRGHAERVYSVAFSRDGKTLAAGSANGTVKFWKAGRREEQEKLPGHKSWVWKAAFSPDSQWLLSVGASGQALLHHLATKQYRDLITADLFDKAFLKRHDAKDVASLKRDLEICSAAFSPAEKRLAVGCEFGFIRVWDYGGSGAPRLLAQFQADPKAPPTSRTIWSLAFSPDGTMLASASEEGSVKIWETKQWRSLAMLRGDREFLNAVAFSSDGKLLATGGRDGIVRIWDTAAWRLLRELHGHSEVIEGLAFSPVQGDDTLFSSSRDATIRRWNARTGREVALLVGHKHGVHSVAISPDGKTLASAGQDYTVRLWNIAENQEVATFKTTAALNGVAFAPDGATLAAADRRNGLWMWRAASLEESERHAAGYAPDRAGGRPEK